MLLAFGQEVQPGTREDIAVFWSDGDDRRAIVDCGYAQAHAVLERLLRRFPGGRGFYEDFRLKVGELAESGTAISTLLDGHTIGLMRPYIAGPPGSQPYIVCRQRRRMPQSPVLCGSIEEARSFARRASQVSGLARSGWRAYRCERLLSPIERLFTVGDNGRVLFRSELEEALSASRSRSRRAAAASRTPTSRRTSSGRQHRRVA